MEDKNKIPETEPTIVTKFNPSENQVKFLQEAIKSCTYKNKTALAEAAGVTRKVWYDWIKQAGFKEWFYGEFQTAIQFKVYELDAIGFRKAETDFKYFEVMMKKYGGLIASVPGVHVNVNASASAEAKSEIELGTEELKKRLSRNLGIMQRYGHLSELVSEE